MDTTNETATRRSVLKSLAAGSAVVGGLSLAGTTQGVDFSGSVPAKDVVWTHPKHVNLEYHFSEDEDARAPTSTNRFGYTNTSEQLSDIFVSLNRDLTYFGSSWRGDEAAEEDGSWVYAFQLTTQGYWLERHGSYDPRADEWDIPPGESPYDYLALFPMFTGNHEIEVTCANCDSGEDTGENPQVAIAGNDLEFQDFEVNKFDGTDSITEFVDNTGSFLNEESAVDEYVEKDDEIPSCLAAAVGVATLPPFTPWSLPAWVNGFKAANLVMNAHDCINWIRNHDEYVTTSDADLVEQDAGRDSGGHYKVSGTDPSNTNYYGTMHSVKIIVEVDANTGPWEISIRDTNELNRDQGNNQQTDIDSYNGTFHVRDGVTDELYPAETVEYTVTIPNNPPGWAGENPDRTNEPDNYPYTGDFTAYSHPPYYPFNDELSPQDSYGDGRYMDLDGDGELTDDDVSLFEKYVSQDAPAEEHELKSFPDAFDYDGDGSVDADDAGMMSQHMVNIESVEGATPQDLNGDGVYRDVNGNDRTDSDDIVTFFVNMNDEAVYDNIRAYDYNGNGRIDFDDVVTLFEYL